MSELQFNITAKDQASAVVTSVQKKVLDFGKDVGRSITAALGPIALLTFAFQKISQYFDDLSQKRKDAFDWGTSLADNAAKMGVTVEEFQRIEDAADKTGKSVDDVGKAFKMARDMIALAKAGNKDAAASLAALGINIQDLDQVKPEEVLSRLAGALSTTVDPAERAALAVAALGKNAKDLQDVLSKGFDIAGAFVDTEDLSTEDAAILKEKERKDRLKGKREKVKLAREEATAEFLRTDPEASRVLGAQKAPGIGAAFVRSLTTWGEVKNPEEEIDRAKSDPAVQAAISKIQADRAKLKADAAAAAQAQTKPQDMARAEALTAVAAERVKAEELAKEEERKRKKDEAEAAKPYGGAKVGVERDKLAGFLGSEEVERPDITVSSLRSIGGGMAGELQVAPEIAEQLKVQRSMAKTLENIERLLDGTSNDQTKYNTETGGPVSAGMLTANA